MRLLVFALAVLAGPALADDPPYDLVIRHAKLVDGTGNPWVYADVAVRGDKIAAVGRIVGPGKREIKADGQFDVVSKTDLVPGDAWSKHLDGSKDLIGDWVEKKCGNFNTKTGKCGGQGS